MRLRQRVMTASEEAVKRAERSLNERANAGRAWRLDCPEQAEHCLRRAVEAEVSVPLPLLIETYAVCDAAELLWIRLGSPGAIEELGKSGAAVMKRWQMRGRTA